MANFHESGKQFTLDIPIFKKSYDFFKDFYRFQLDFPKKDRYTLGQRCEECLLDVLEGIIAAAQAGRSEKAEILMRASAKADLLKVFIRLAADLKILSDKRYILCQNCLQEIGRMLGGWLKSVREDKTKKPLAPPKDLFAEDH
jgi:four helix bundle protein